MVARHHEGGTNCALKIAKLGAHGCNLSYSGGRDQENHSSKPAQANSSVRPYLKTPYHKNRVGGVAQGEDPEFKPQCRKKKKS
jgi:hypothetical protein